MAQCAHHRSFPSTPPPPLHPRPNPATLPPALNEAPEEGARHDPSRRLERVRPRARERHRPRDLPRRHPRRHRRRPRTPTTASTPPPPPSTSPSTACPPTASTDTDVLLWWGHKAHGAGRRRHRRPRRPARPRGHGPDRPPLRPLLEDLQAPDGHPLLACAGARPASASGSGSSTAPTRSCSGLGDRLELPNEEMYGEPFLVPEPLETVLISWFEGGEVFRSGLTYQRGAGRIFYFRPGHETYPTYHDADRPADPAQRRPLGLQPRRRLARRRRGPERPRRQGPGEDHPEGRHPAQARRGGLPVTRPGHPAPAPAHPRHRRHRPPHAEQLRRSSPAASSSPPST